MKYKLIVCLIIIVCVFLFIGNTKEESTEDNFRIRVIANSNDSDDIKIKEECFKIIKKYIKADNNEKDVENNLKYIKNDLDIVSKRINMKIIVSIEKAKFPPKSLNGKIIEGGYYKALIVKIGKALGNNYWTLLYPEYFGITFEDIKSENVEIRWYFKDLFE